MWSGKQLAFKFINILKYNSRAKGIEKKILEMQNINLG